MEARGGRWERLPARENESPVTSYRHVSIHRSLSRQKGRGRKGDGDRRSAEE